MDSDDDLLTVRLAQQLLEERVGVRQSLLLDDAAVGDQAISPVEGAVVLLAQSFDHEDRLCKAATASAHRIRTCGADCTSTQGKTLALVTVGSCR